MALKRCQSTASVFSVVLCLWFYMGSLKLAKTQCESSWADDDSLLHLMSRYKMHGGYHIHLKWFDKFGLLNTCIVKTTTSYGVHAWRYKCESPRSTKNPLIRVEWRVVISGFFGGIN